MRKFITFLSLLCVIGVSIAGPHILSGLRGKAVNSWTEKLNIATAGAADTSAIHETHRFMTLTMEPGLSATAPDSFALDRDSTGVDVFVQFLSNKTGTGGAAGASVVGHLQVFNPFQGQLASAAANIDSYSVAIDLLNPLATSLTAGTGSWDSTLIYLNQLVDRQKEPVMGEWMRVIIDDSTDNTAQWGSTSRNQYTVRVTYSD